MFADFKHYRLRPFDIVRTHGYVSDPPTIQFGGEVSDTICVVISPVNRENVGAVGFDLSNLSALDSVRNEDVAWKPSPYSDQLRCSNSRSVGVRSIATEFLVEN